MNRIVAGIAGLSVLSLPLLVLAQAPTAPQPAYITSLITQASNIVNLLLPFLVAIAVLAFFYGLAKFVFSAGNEEARKEARSIMVWGVIAIAVMISVYGLVLLLQSIFGIQNTPTVNVPSVPTR